MNTPYSHRYLSIDIMRTVAIGMMIVYHLLFDLWYMFGVDIELFQGFWKAWQLVTVYLFLGLVGMSFAASSHTKTMQQVWKRAIWRFGVIFTCAVLITVVTYALNSKLYVRFGILHCIAISILVLTIFYKKPWSAAIAGLLIISLGFRIQNTILYSSFLKSILFIPLGIPPSNFATLDYFPLLPWTGVVLLGYTIGHILYSRNTLHKDERQKIKYQYLLWPGKHSLFLYMIHQPVILGILHLALQI